MSPRSSTWVCPRGPAMNAVVLTAVLSCLNSACTRRRACCSTCARNERPCSWSNSAPARPLYRDLVLVGDRLPVRDHVLARPRTVFCSCSTPRAPYLVRLLADRAVTDRAAPPTPEEKLQLKMWFFPVLSILTLAASPPAGADGVRRSARSQLWLSLLSWRWCSVVLRRRARPPRLGRPGEQHACSNGSLPKPAASTAHMLGRLVPGDHCASVMRTSCRAGASARASRLEVLQPVAVRAVGQQDRDAGLAVDVR